MLHFPIHFSQDVSHVFHGTKDHDILLVREVLAVNPFTEPKGSRERAKLWEKVAISLNAITAPRFSVTVRSVRNRVNLVLIKKYKKRIAEEEKASGIEVEPESEFDRGMELICERAEASDRDHQDLAQEKKEIIELEKKAAEEIRFKAMETMGRTQKRTMTTTTRIRSLQNEV